MASISKRASGAWQSASCGIRGTATDTITTLPTTIYSDRTNATVSIKGNTTQSSTPTPENPVMPQGCGELETVGAKAGQYKILISSANTTTNVYLGEAQTTRRVKKLVLTGEETWAKSLTRDGAFYCLWNNFGGIKNYLFYCDRCEYVDDIDYYVYGTCFSDTALNLWIGNAGWSVNNFKSYLAQQYAAGTPVTIWYVLETETTGIVNEPLMRIGDYADEVSGVSIPTTDGANTLSVDTTVQPSEVSINYHGWHMGAVHEHNSGQWD